VFFFFANCQPLAREAQQQSTKSFNMGKSYEYAAADELADRTSSNKRI
jgi:hypothetical protein